MRLPNKVITYNQSILSKFPIILDILQHKPCKISELYDCVKEYMDIGDFLDTLDSLYALEKIVYDDQRGMLYYAI